MKSVFNCFLVLLLVFCLSTFKVLALEKETYSNKSEIIIANKYAERYCNAKDNKFFEGLDNERTLKYSYYRYIGFLNEEIFSNEMYKILINQIREKCLIKNEEEKEIIEYFLGNPLQR